MLIRKVFLLRKLISLETSKQKVNKLLISECSGTQSAASPLHGFSLNSKSGTQICVDENETISQLH